MSRKWPRVSPTGGETARSPLHRPAWTQTLPLRLLSPFTFVELQVFILLFLTLLLIIFENMAPPWCRRTRIESEVSVN